MASKALGISEQPSARSRWSEPESTAILEQLERILANPLFRNSKRYPNLLRYVVEQTLQGQTSQLKERTLGIEVFGRDPDYDTNLDPVVRTSAGEIRKRIAQYYHEQGRENEIRIDLPLGSYVPEIRMPAAVSGALPAPAPPALLQLTESPAIEPPSVLLGRQATRMRRWAPAALALVSVALLLWFKPWKTKTTLEKFWTPVVEVANPVLLCVGPDPNVRVVDAGATGGTAAPSPSNIAVALRDVTTIARVAGVLQVLGKPYRIRAQSATSFADLRDGPVVLIGAFNNDWTIRLTGVQRFNFEQDSDFRWIADRRNPSRKDWAVNLTTPLAELVEDYALISRLLDPTTDRMVVVAAGLRGYGTTAAGEFLTSPEYLASIAKGAPKNWEHKNLQVVLATKVINGNSGPPRVVAANFW
jgi:hypothetical protein